MKPLSQKAEKNLEKKWETEEAWKNHPNKMFLKSLGEFFVAVIFAIVVLSTTPYLKPYAFTSLLWLTTVGTVVLVLYAYYCTLGACLKALDTKKQSPVWVLAYVFGGLMGAVVVVALQDKRAQKQGGY